MCFFLCVACVFFFFFKQKTAYEMRSSDWSSDVCSSDLLFPLFLKLLGIHRALPALVALCVVVLLDAAAPWSPGSVSWRMLTHEMSEIGRASCRERVCQYV